MQYNRRNVGDFYKYLYTLKDVSAIYIANKIKYNPFNLNFSDRLILEASCESFEIPFATEYSNVSEIKLLRAITGNGFYDIQCTTHLIHKLYAGRFYQAYEVLNTDYWSPYQHPSIWFKNNLHINLDLLHTADYFNYGINKLEKLIKENYLNEYENIVISCTNLPTIGVIENLEYKLNTQIISSNSSLFAKIKRDNNI